METNGEKYEGQWQNDMRHGFGDEGEDDKANGAEGVGDNADCAVFH